MSFFNFDKNESEEDKLFHNNDFQMELSDYDAQEIENKMFNDTSKLYEIYNKMPKSDRDELATLMAYRFINNEMLLNKTIEFSDGKLEPYHILHNENGVYMAPFIMFGLFKRGLIYNKKTYDIIKNMYNNHYNFHRKSGEKEFQFFITYVAMGWCMANDYYNKNMSEIVNEQINNLEKEINHV